MSIIDYTVETKTESYHSTHKLEFAQGFMVYKLS